LFKTIADIFDCIYGYWKPCYDMIDWRKKGNIKRLSLSLFLSFFFYQIAKPFQNWGYVPLQKSLSNFVLPFVCYVRPRLWSFEKWLTYEWPSKGKFHGFVCTACTNRRNRAPESALCYPHTTPIPAFSYTRNNVPCHQVCIEFTSPLQLLVRSIWRHHTPGHYPQRELETTEMPVPIR